MDHPSPDPEMTRLLLAWNAGETSAMEQLTPLVHDELRRLGRGGICARNGRIIRFRPRSW